MPLIRDTDTEAQQMVAGWLTDAGHRLKARREKPMAGTKEYEVTEQLFNGHRTLDRGEILHLTDAQAASLKDYVKPAGKAAKADKDDEPDGPENRMVSGGGKSGRGGKG